MSIVESQSVSRRGAIPLALLAIAAAGCGSSAASPEPSHDAGGGADARTDAGPPPLASKIAHVVIIVQENHTFDVEFGAYCQAAAGSKPTCTTGPTCCEAMPATDPAGHSPIVLDDTEEAAFDPNHTQACELAEMDNGKMDAYATATVPGSSTACGDSRNVASASPTIVKPYWDLAQTGALADRYFQPIAGQSSSNDMYLARASYVFTDNSASPLDALGVKCSLGTTQKAFMGTTIGDLLTAASVPWAWFADGYQTMLSAPHGTCPPAPADCPLALPLYPCSFDPSDIPFEYYASTRDNPSTMKDLSVFQAAIQSGSGLPAVSFIKAIGYRSEHPGYGSTLSAG
ncbi:MAG: alkaline phosphatase family protein, partial [Polyangiaceae bacterium]